MAQLLVTIGPWLGILVAFYLAAMTPSCYANYPRRLALTIRISAASYGATIALRQLFIYRHAETAELVSAAVGLMSVLVLVVALFFAMSIGRYRRGPTK